MLCRSSGEAIDASQQPVYLYLPPHVHVRLPAKPVGKPFGCAGMVLLLVALIVFLITSLRY